MVAAKVVAPSPGSVTSYLTITDDDSVKHPIPTYYNNNLWPSDIPLQRLREEEYRYARQMWESSALIQAELELDTFKRKPRFFKLSIPRAPSPREEEEHSTPEPEPEHCLDLPLKIRHRFLNWLVFILEATYVEQAREHGERYENMDTMMLRRQFDDGKQWKQSEYPSDLPCCVAEIYQCTEEIRHSAIHRKNIGMTDLTWGMSLARLFGNKKREAEITRVYDFVCRYSVDCTDKVCTLEMFEDVLTVSGSVDPVVELYTKIQFMIEASMFRYTQRNDPDLLKEKKWSEPEQVEMPLWEKEYRTKQVEQDIFHDEDGYIFRNFLKNARDLRNRAAHRHYQTEEEVVDIALKAIQCLMAIGDQKAAVEVEILAEQHLAEVTRDKVLQRIRKAYLAEQMPSEDDVFARRREQRRRAAIAEILESAPPCEDESSSYTDLVPVATEPEQEDQEGVRLDEAADCQSAVVPTQIIVTDLYDWEIRRQTISPSMHPKLRYLPDPCSSIICHSSETTIANVEQWVDEVQDKPEEQDTPSDIASEYEELSVESISDDPSSEDADAKSSDSDLSCSGVLGELCLGMLCELYSSGFVIR